MNSTKNSQLNTVAAAELLACLNCLLFFMHFNEDYRNVEVSEEGTKAAAATVIGIVFATAFGMFGPIQPRRSRLLLLPTFPSRLPEILLKCFFTDLPTFFACFTSCIEVSEEGTKAAAATVIGMVGMAMPLGTLDHTWSTLYWIVINIGILTI